MKSIVNLVLACLMLSSSSFGQQSCLSDVEGVFTHMAELMSSEQCLYYEVSTETGVPGKTEALKERMQVTLAPGFRLMKASRVEVLMDKEHTYRIDHDAKEISVMNTNSGDFQRAAVIPTQYLLERLKLQVEDVNCAEENGQVKVVLDIKPEAVAEARTERLELVYDKELNFLSSSSCEFVEGSPYTFMKAAYGQVKLNYTSPVTGTSVKTLIYDQNGQLNENYKAYKIKDLRA